MEKQENLGDIFEFILIGVIVAFIVVAIFGYLDARIVRTNDFYRAGTLITAALQMLDMLSDCFLAIDISFAMEIDPDKPYGIFLYVCIICIALPSLMSLFQVYYFSSRIWGNDNKIREWLLKYSKLLYIGSVLTGSSFTAVEIMNSNFLALQYFDMGLSQRQMIGFKSQRIYSVVILEVCSIHSSINSLVTYLQHNKITHCNVLHRIFLNWRYKYGIYIYWEIQRISLPFVLQYFQEYL